VWFKASSGAAIALLYDHVLYPASIQLNTQ
jgi:hypothetical protein